MCKPIFISTFLQIENGADPDYIVGFFNLVDKDSVMANLPFIAHYIKQCVKEEDLSRIFVYDDFSITIPGRSFPTKIGNIQVNAKPIPQDIHEHTNQVLCKLAHQAPKRPPSPSFSSVTSKTTATPWSFSSSLAPSHSQKQLKVDSNEQRFQHIEARLDNMAARMDSIEDLCYQLKGNTDMITGQLTQLTTELKQQSQSSSPSTFRLAKFS